MFIHVVSLSDLLLLPSVETLLMDMCELYCASNGHVLAVLCFLWTCVSCTVLLMDMCELYCTSYGHV
jgi:hypothetical protein